MIQTPKVLIRVEKHLSELVELAKLRLTPDGF